MLALIFTGRTVRYAVSIFLVIAFLYWLPAAVAGHLQSPPFAYFDQLAEAFLHGRLYLLSPPVTHDLTFSQGNWYIPFSPLPALLMLPWVYLFGEINTVYFTIIMGAINAVLVFLLLQSLHDLEQIFLKNEDKLWIVFFFSLGTGHWYLSTVGAVWFTSQICAVTFILLALWLVASQKSPIWVGGALSLAMLARPHVALLYPLLLAIAIAHRRLRNSQGPYFYPKWMVLSLLPMIFMVGLLLTYNSLRFGNAFDFGYRTENVSENLVHSLSTYGQFSSHYIARNLYVMLAALPRWNVEQSWFTPDWEGMSLLITSPALIFLYKGRPNTALALGAWLSVGLVLIPLIMYYNTGRDQFGYRFSMDFIGPVLILLAKGFTKEVTKNLRALIVLSIAMNTWGVICFHRLY